MTISKTGNKNQYTGDGTTTAFAFQYRFFDDTDLGVYVLASGVETKQTLTTHYTVTNTGTEDGGTITFVTAPASGTTVTILGEIPETQTADYEANDPFPAETHEAALDRGVRLIQQQQEAIGRALIAPISDTASLELPLDRASKFLGFDASKNPVALAGTTGVQVSAFVEPALASADAAAFQAAIDIDAGITFTPRTGVSYAEGLLYYDDDRKSLTFFNDEADVALNVGQELWVFARNATGSTITNGQAVYVSGASGNKPTIALADADTEATSRIIGLATHDIENNSNGFICVSGEVRSVDTSAFSAGDLLYLSSTAGALTDTLPGDGKFNHIVGVVLNNHATQGIILVVPQCLSHTLAQAAWNTGTSTQEANISPAKLEAKIDNKIAPHEDGEDATTSGTAHDFTSIPAGINHIDVNLNGVSLSGTDSLLIQISTGSTFATSGYVSTSGGVTSTGQSQVSSTSGIVVQSTGAANEITGIVTITRVPGTNTWISAHSIRLLTNSIAAGGGSVTLGGVLDGVRLTRTGSDTFDAGGWSIRCRT